MAADTALSELLDATSEALGLAFDRHVSFDDAALATLSALLDAIELHRDVDVRSRPMRVALNRCKQAFAPPRNVSGDVDRGHSHGTRHSSGDVAEVFFRRSRSGCRKEDCGCNACAVSLSYWRVRASTKQVSGAGRCIATQAAAPGQDAEAWQERTSSGGSRDCS